MTFEEAMIAVLDGRSVRRAGWFDRRMRVWLSDAGLMRSRPTMTYPYRATVSDTLADDWEVHEQCE